MALRQVTDELNECEHVKRLNTAEKHNNTAARVCEVLLQILNRTSQMPIFVRVHCGIHNGYI